MRVALAVSAALALGALSGAARAVDVCELNGQSINPNNGNTTQGKTGLMRCRDGEGGPIRREQELRNGVFMGVVRFFREGAIEREHSVNERGNRDGVAREYARADAGGKPVLVGEETYRDGKTVGLARSWYPTGQLRRVSFHGDDDREQAAAEFTQQGRLAELRCGPRAVLGADADDGHWCGHAGGPAIVVLYSGKGLAKARLLYERGERRKSELLGDDGGVREVQEVNASGGVERTFAADGVKRHEVQWLTTQGGERSRRITTLDQEFHESGKLVRERRWRIGERGGELVGEQRWYLNGQPKEQIEFIGVDGRPSRRQTFFHDNGKKSFEGLWKLAAPGSRAGEAATGVHRNWDGEGHLRSERIHDERGRVTRERELEANGTVVRDDEVFEDGSRKALGR